MRRFLTRLVIIVVIAVAAAFALRAYVVAPYYVPSASMEPTLHGCPNCSDDHILVDKVSYRLHDPRTSDLVVFNRPKNVHTAENVLVKRVIGLPGQQVALVNGIVEINGKKLDEPYLRKACGRAPSKPHTGRSRWKVPANQVFLMGDNRCNSTDSRDFGPVERSSIIGRAFAIIWPLSRVRLL